MPPRELLGLYDVRVNRWLPTARAVAGLAPSCRSSHRRAPKCYVGVKGGVESASEAAARNSAQRPSVCGHGGLHACCAAPPIRAALVRGWNCALQRPGASSATLSARRASPDGPRPRRAARAVAVAGGMLVYGGVDGGRRRLGDMHWLGPAAADAARLQWSCVDTPGPRQPCGALSSADLLYLSLSVYPGRGSTPAQAADSSAAGRLPACWRAQAMCLCPAGTELSPAGTVLSRCLRGPCAVGAQPRRREALSTLTLTLTSARSGAGRAAFSLDVVGSALYLAGGYSNAKMYAADMWVLRMPAHAAEARPPRSMVRACLLCAAEYGEHCGRLMLRPRGAATVPAYHTGRREQLASQW